ncbi:MAG TPA: DUF3224 domain-containing protein [Gemmatimonadaceae bacterium]|nr:DUF3224 domain-containing protein [Gemmatimonadaceae bacterium]
MTTHAKGTFDVQLHALAMEDIANDAMLGRMSSDKQLHGDLTGTTQGQMLTVGTTTSGSQVYVAVERVTATLGGKHGTFALHHRGVMNRGKATLEISVVPDSGTGELAGITGTLAIDVKDGEHLYDFEYTLP